MFSTFWAWLRRQARDSILAGVEDAAQELSPGGEYQEAIERLKKLAAPKDQRKTQQPTEPGNGTTTELVTAGGRRGGRKE